jgi:hypothetical protein
MRRANGLIWTWMMVFIAGMVFWPGCKKTDASTEPANGEGSIITVTGTAIGGNLHALQHFPVAIAGHTATVTDDNGAFSVSGVNTPYDITVIDPTNSSALVYIGLTRPDPTVIWQTQTTGVDRSGSVQGALSGGSFVPTQGQDDRTKILLYLSSTSWDQASIDGAQSGDFSVGATWKDALVCPGTVFALQFAVDPATGLPAANGFKGFGSLPNVPVTDQTVITGQSLNMQALSPSQTGQFSATITMPAGMSLTAKSLFLRPNANGLIPILNDTTLATAVTYNAPNIPDGTLTFGVTGTDAKGAQTNVIKGGLGAGGSGQAITLAAPPELTLPVADANSVDATTEFSWMPFTGGVHVVFFTPAVGGNPSYQVVTTDRTCQLPNLKPYGLTVPPAQQYSWRIIALGPVSSVNDAADPALFAPLRQRGDITTTMVMASTPSRTFRTAP